MSKVRIAGAALAAVSLLAGAGACGDKKDTDAAAVRHYCDLAKQLKDAGDALPEPQSEDDAVATIAKLVQDNGALMDDYVASAPDEIHADVAKLMRGMRAVPTTHSFKQMEAAGDSEAKIHAFDAKHCGIPNPSDEQ